LPAQILMEASMCHLVHVWLTAEEKSAVKRLSGLLIPVYAAVVLAVIAVAVVAPGSGRTELIASRSVPAMQH
jgi:hypothetical protein